MHVTRRQPHLLPVLPPLRASGLLTALVFADARSRWRALLAIDEAYEPKLSPSALFDTAADAFEEFTPHWELFKYWAPAIWVMSEHQQ